ncbi:NAD(P)-binding domain-containing protein, partial [Streptomyces achromogenes]
MTRTAHGPVAVLGLGAMGAGLAHRLLDQGIPVRVWTVRRKSVSTPECP